MTAISAIPRLTMPQIGPANQMILSTLARRRFRRFATEQQNGSTAGATDSSPARREASAGNKEQTN